MNFIGRLFSYFTGVTMFINPSIWMYNIRRSIDPIKVETSVQAREYGDKMLKKWFPQKNLEDDKDEEYPFVDYRKFPVQNLNVYNDKWVLCYEKEKDCSPVLLGCKRSSPIVWIDKDTGKIYFPLRGR